MDKWRTRSCLRREVESMTKRYSSRVIVLDIDEHIFEKSDPRNDAILTYNSSRVQVPNCSEQKLAFRIWENKRSYLDSRICIALKAMISEIPLLKDKQYSEKPVLPNRDQAKQKEFKYI